MAIVISGVNNNDKITASDGTIDLLSGVNFNSEITVPSFKVGSNIQIGNAGIITATTFTGNVTGNINNDILLLQTGSNERVRIDSSGRVLIGTTTEGRVEADDLTIATTGTTGITLRAGAGNAGNIMFSDGTSGDDEMRGTIQYHHLFDEFRFFTNAVKRMIISSAGRVGIGSDNPVAHLDVANYQNIETLRLRDRHFNKYLTIRGGGSPNRMVIDSYEGGGGGAAIDLASNGDTKLRIDSNGRALYSRGGLTASRNVGTKTGEIQVANGGNSSAISIISYTNDVGGPHLVFGKSRAGNATGSTIVQDGDRLGEIAFCGADGTDIDSFGAAIKAHVDGTPGANDMPGRLEFYTTGDGGSSSVERVRIPSTGGIELKTDGKGIQFPTPQTPYHASSNRVGISSEMRYYETGTLTPGLSSTVLNGLQIATFTDGSYARRVNRYVRVGHIVHCFIEIKMAGSVTYNAGSTSTAPVCITGTCPFKWAYSGRYDVSGEPDFIPCSISYDSSGLTNDSVYAVLTRNYNAQPRIDITRVGSGGSRQFNSVNFGMVFPANASIAVAYSYPIDLDNADY